MPKTINKTLSAQEEVVSDEREEVQGERILLSQLLLAKEGFPLPAELDEACDHASQIRKSLNPTSFEKVWLDDFLEN